MNDQNDTQWANESMGIPDDTISEFGCLLTVDANIIQHFGMIRATIRGEEYEPFTPSELNTIAKTHGWYYGEAYKEQESMLRTNDLFAFFNMKREKIGFEHYVYDPQKYQYYAKISLYGKPHFVNIIQKYNRLYQIFDVLFGEVRYIEENEIKQLYRVQEVFR